MIMLSGIHFLLTYSCNFACDHCFLYCGPEAEGTFTLNQLKAVFDQMEKIKSISMVYFEGGEPFLYYPLMLEGLRLAQDRGFKAGVVTNAYWATSVEDAELWLKPLQRIIKKTSVPMFYVNPMGYSDSWSRTFIDADIPIFDLWDYPVKCMAILAKYSEYRKKFLNNRD